LNWPQYDSQHLMVSSEQMQTIEKKMFSMGMPVEALMEKVGIGISTWILDRQGLIENGAIVLVGQGTTEAMDLLLQENFIWQALISLFGVHSH